MYQFIKWTLVVLVVLFASIAVPLASAVVGALPKAVGCWVEDGKISISGAIMVVVWIGSSIFVLVQLVDWDTTDTSSRRRDSVIERLKKDIQEKDGIIKDLTHELHCAERALEQSLELSERKPWSPESNKP